MSSKQTKNEDTSIAVIKNDIGYIRNDLTEIKNALTTNYVTKDQFNPVKRIAYGAVALLAGLVVTVAGFLVSRSH